MATPSNRKILGLVASISFCFVIYSSQFGNNIGTNNWIPISKIQSNDSKSAHQKLKVIPGISRAYTTLPELHEIMSKQYDVQIGKYKGAPYKKILYWNSFVTLHNSEEYGMGIGRDGYRKAGCPVWQCETSKDRTNLTQYDAVLFQFRSWNGSDLPPVRLPHQRYIFFAKEPPAWGFAFMDHSHLDLKNFFNWTMTYRWDSDVVHPYGWIEPIDPLMDVNILKKILPKRNYAAGKTKMAVWFNSNCMSMAGRDELVTKLVEHGIQLDIYGACGNMTCSITPYAKDNITNVEELQLADEECRKMAAQKYKFYLALENSNCLYYMSEKFFANLRHPIIPVVIDAHGQHARAAPPHSFINALDFPTINHLVDYLFELDRNDTLYNQYFWWKDHYRVRNGVQHEGLHYKTFCSLCAALHEREHEERQSYESMRNWWESSSDCRSVHYDPKTLQHYTRHPPFCSPSNICTGYKASRYILE